MSCERTFYDNFAILGCVLLLQYHVTIPTSEFSPPFIKRLFALLLFALLLFALCYNWIKFKFKIILDWLEQNGDNSGVNYVINIQL